MRTKYTLLRLVGVIILELMFPLQGIHAANEPQDILFIDFTDHTSVEFQLADKPYVLFGTDSLFVKTDVDMAKYSLQSVGKFYFTSKATDIQSAEDGNRMVFRFVDNETLIVSGCQEETLSLYDASGKCVARERAKMQVVTFRLKDKGKGIYILHTASGQQIKFLKR